jgi:hypothetical protein
MRRTNALIDCVHAHILIQLCCGVFVALRPFRPSLFLQLFYVFHTLLQFRRTEISEWKPDDDDRSGEVICEVESFRQFSSDDGKEEPPFALDLRKMTLQASDRIGCNAYRWVVGVVDSGGVVLQDLINLRGLLRLKENLDSIVRTCPPSTMITSPSFSRQTESEHRFSATRLSQCSGNYKKERRRSSLGEPRLQS